MDVGNGMQCVWPLYIPHQLLVLLGSTGRLDIRKHFNREKLTERDFERKRLLQIRPRYLLRIYLLRQFSHRTFENLVDSRSTPSQPLGAKPNSIMIVPLTGGPPVSPMKKGTRMKNLADSCTLKSALMGG